VASFRPTAIIHLAAESHVDRSIDAPLQSISTNVLGTAVLLSAAYTYWRGLSPDDRERFRFVHVSTDEVYGSLGPTGQFNELSPYRPNSPYSASKAGADHLVRAWYLTYGLPTLTTHCSNNYGPMQYPEKLIPLMIRRAVAGLSLPVYGRGENMRDWLYVEDHADALVRVLCDGRPGETYAIGGHCEVRNVDLVCRLCSILDEQFSDSQHTPHASRIEFVTDRPGHDLRYAIDASRMRNELGWTPATGFDEGLRKTVAWYLANDAWVSAVLAGSRALERVGMGTGIS
jgi:dTDP-glucose 4,6-dehydratase